MGKTLHFAILIFTILSTPLAAQEQEGMWSLEQCMQYAIDNAPQIKQQQLYNANARQNYIASVANLLPSISGSVGTNSSFGRSIDPESNSYTNTSTFNNTYSISGSMVVFNGFRLVNSLKISKIGRLLGKEQLQLAHDQISLSVMQNYFNVVFYMGYVQIAQEKLQESRQNLFRAQELEKLGLRSSSDVALVEAQVATDDAAVINSQNALTSAWNQLKNVMNYPLEDSLPIDTRIEMIEDIPTEGAQELFVDAQRFHPTARMTELRLKQSRLEHAVSKGALFPSISVSGGYTTNYYNTNLTNYMTFGNQIKNNGGEYIAVSMQIPLFNKLSYRTAKNRTRNNIAITELDNELTMQQLQTEIKQVIDNCRGLAKEYDQADKQVEANTLAHKAIQRKYDEGLLSAIELQTSANRLQEARSNLLRIKLDYIINYRMIRYYQGVPLIDQIHNSR